MQNPLQITFHDMDHNEDIEAMIREKFEKVRTVSPDMTKCHVVLEKLSKHHQTANMACVRLDLKVPHFEDIVVTEKCLEDAASLKSAVLKVFKQGLDLAHKHKKRRLDHKRLTLGDLPAVEPVETGD